jgi:spermidine/putrescine transport system substrate-binding protein
MTNASGPVRAAAGAPHVSRRGILVAGASGAFSIVLGLGRSVRAQQVQGPLNMLGWAEYVSPANIAAWEEMTGTRLIYDAYSSNDEMLSKLQLAGGASGYDVGMNTDFMIPLLINRELIDEFDKPRLPHLANVDPDFLGRDFDPENNYTVPKSWGSQGYIYDREVIQRESARGATSSTR